MGDQNQAYYTILIVEQQVLFNSRRRLEESSREKDAKSFTKHQPKRGGLQRPDRAVTPGANTTIRGIGRKLRLTIA